MIEPTWTREAPGVYTWADYTIRREATTLRRASNPAWSVFRHGVERRIARRATLVEAKSRARADSARRQS